MTANRCYALAMMALGASMIIFAFVILRRGEHDAERARPCDASVYLANEDYRSVPNDRIHTPGDVTIKIAPRGAIALVRVSDTSRWITWTASTKPALAPVDLFRADFTAIPWSGSAFNDVPLPVHAMTLVLSPTCDRPITITGITPSSGDVVDGRVVVIFNESYGTP